MGHRMGQEVEQEKLVFTLRTEIIGAKVLQIVLALRRCGADLLMPRPQPFIDFIH